MTVGEIESKMSSYEFLEWMAYFELEPFGEERADARQAITSALLASAHGGDSNPMKYMPNFENAKRATESVEQKTKNFFAHLRGLTNG